MVGTFCHAVLPAWCTSAGGIVNVAPSQAPLNQKLRKCGYFTKSYENVVFLRVVYGPEWGKCEESLKVEKSQ